MRTLLVLRHAETEHRRPGSTDHARRLTPRGEARASALGLWLRERGQPVDRVLCSSAIRAQQTYQALGLSVPEDRVEIDEVFYNAGGDTVLERIRELDDTVADVLVVGHAPGLPSVVYELADPATSDPQALADVDGHYPAGTLAVLRSSQAWSGLDHAQLIAVRLP
jgi:phosphohistidine phosphatase